MILLHLCIPFPAQDFQNTTTLANSIPSSGNEKGGRSHLLTTYMQMLHRLSHRCDRHFYLPHESLLHHIGFPCCACTVWPCSQSHIFRIHILFHWSRNILFLPQNFHSRSHPHGKRKRLSLPHDQVYTDSHNCVHKSVRYISILA